MHTNDELEKEIIPTTSFTNPSGEEIVSDENQDNENINQTEEFKITINDIGKNDISINSEVGLINVTLKDNYIQNIDYQTPIVNGTLGSASISANIKKEEDKYDYNLQANYTKDNFNANINSSKDTYSLDGSYSTENESGFSSSISLHKDNNEQYISLNASKAFNPNNINNTNDTYKTRKEELLTSEKTVSFESKVGYNDGFYNNNSLMVKINENVLNSSYNTSKTTETIAFGIDLKKTKIDYSRETSKEEVNKTVTDKISADLKTQKNQYNINLSNVKTTVCDEEQSKTSSTNFVIGTSIGLNRNEYGEFSSGLSGSASNSISIKDGKVNEYSIEANGAYNYYGDEHGSSSDYLISTSCKYSKDENNKRFSSDIFSAIRMNNCRTILEPSVSYETTRGDESSEKTVTTRLGVYQQVGKEFGRASIFTKVYGGKKFSKECGTTNKNLFGGIAFGGDCRISKNITVTAKSTYDSKEKFSGEIGGRIAF